MGDQGRIRNLQTEGWEILDEGILQNADKKRNTFPFQEQIQKF